MPWPHDAALEIIRQTLDELSTGAPDASADVALPVFGTVRVHRGETMSEWAAKLDVLNAGMWFS